MKAMRGRVIAGMVVVAFTVFAILAVLSGRTVAQSPFGDHNAEPAPFNPQMSALMSMLIQPRHAKLGLAGKAENWPLAAYAFRELKQGFAVAARAVPRWKGLPVPDLFDAALSQSLGTIDAAIKLKYKPQFNEAYGRLTEGCNNCHATTSHPFIVIKVPPDASALPNQDFEPKQ